MLKHWWQWFAYTLGYSLFAVFFFFCYEFRFRGRERVPRKGGLLVIANHQSFFDPPLVGIAVHRPLTYVARKTLFRSRFLAWLMRQIGTIPIDQEAVGKEGLKATLALLRAGHALVVFPEGARTPHGDLQPLKPGVVLLIRQAKVPILPVGIAGAYDSYSIHQKYPSIAPFFLSRRRRSIAVVIGKPIDPRNLIDLPRDEILAKLSGTLADLHRQAEALRPKIITES
jgi:1-acyl-sn-glycerol-3-phosphate acyltransferase